MKDSDYKESIENSYFVRSSTEDLARMCIANAINKTDQTKYDYQIITDKIPYKLIVKKKQ